MIYTIQQPLQPPAASRGCIGLVCSVLGQQPYVSLCNNNWFVSLWLEWRKKENVSLFDVVIIRCWLLFHQHIQTRQYNCLDSLQNYIHFCVTWSLLCWRAVVTVICWDTSGFAGLSLALYRISIANTTSLSPDKSFHHLTTKMVLIWSVIKVRISTRRQHVSTFTYQPKSIRQHVLSTGAF